MLRERFCSQSNALKSQDQCNALVKHFHKYHGWHNYPDDRFSDLFNLTQLKKFSFRPDLGVTKDFRLNREQVWIDTLNTVVPCGMNTTTSKPKKKNWTNFPNHTLSLACESCLECADRRGVPNWQQSLGPLWILPWKGTPSTKRVVKQSMIAASAIPGTELISQSYPGLTGACHRTSGWGICASSLHYCYNEQLSDCIHPTFVNTICVCYITWY